MLAYVHLDRTGVLVKLYLSEVILTKLPHSRSCLRDLRVWRIAWRPTGTRLAHAFLLGISTEYVVQCEWGGVGLGM